MSPTDGSIEAPSLLRAVERALIRVPRSSHHGLTKTPTAIRIAGRTYLDLARLGNIAAVQVPEVVLAARLYHLAYTHRSMAVTGQCALWATGRASDPPVPPHYHRHTKANAPDQATRGDHRISQVPTSHSQTPPRPSFNARRRCTRAPDRKPRVGAGYRREDIEQPTSRIHTAMHDRPRLHAL